MLYVQEPAETNYLIKSDFFRSVKFAQTQINNFSFETLAVNFILLSFLQLQLLRERSSCRDILASSRTEATA